MARRHADSWLDAVASVVTAIVLGAETFVTLWLRVVTRPDQAFNEEIVPREQIRAIGFAAGTVLIWLAIHTIATTTGVSLLDTDSVLIWLIVAGLIIAVVTPIGVHLAAAIATVVLIVVARDRADISETVQVVALSMAPGILIAVPSVEVQAAAVLYGSILLIYGLRVVHRVPVERAVLAAIVPAYLLFWVGFGGDAAIIELLRRWYII